MEKKNTLMVILMASVLVLTGFSAISNEKAYAGGANIPAGLFGDFACWTNTALDDEEIDAPTVNVNIVVQDQFGFVQNDFWEQVEYCAAAEKTLSNGDHFVSPFDFGPFTGGLEQHYQGWFYPEGTENLGTGTTVIIDVPQFDTEFETVLGPLDLLLVPATKFFTLDPQEVGDVIPSQEVLQHWNCYEIEGPFLDEDIELETQHGFALVNLSNPFLFCAPVIKFTDFGEQTEQAFGNLLDEHMICYDVSIEEDRSDGLPIALADQLTIADPLTDEFALLEIQELELFCAPAFKSFPVVGGSMVPIDQSALLLAGVQSVSMWMIPVVIAGIGIGIFVIKRKK